MDRIWNEKPFSLFGDSIGLTNLETLSPQVSVYLRGKDSGARFKLKMHREH